ncbi:MAG TPA: AAA family ATPase [Bacteroidales bacterium]|nr:AAA family ATPase [Bacteroidales bacterium]
MANKVLVLGEPGTGKTSSLGTLDPSSTFIICPDEKSLPFKGWRNLYKTVTKEDKKLDLQKTNFYKTTSPRVILSLMKTISDEMPHIKTIVIDTLTSMQIAEYMDKLKEKGFEKFTEMAADTYNILKYIDKLRADLTVVVMAHVENNYDSDGVLRTSFKVPGGKLIGQNIKVEGMFTIVLYTEVTMENNIPQYHFVTQNNGKNTCKSPKDMFDSIRIPNDMDYVIKRINEYENNE